MAGAAAASVRSASPLHPLPSAKRRIEALQNQLPLRPGRQVVCKEPKSASGGDAEPGWILAKVVKMIGADKMRYEVEDADDEGERKSVSKTQDLEREFFALTLIAFLSKTLQHYTQNDHPSG